MSTVEQLAREQPVFVSKQWLQDVPARDCHPGTQEIVQIPSHLHAETARAHTMRGSPANENNEWEGGFDCHLGVYRRA